MKVIFRIPRFDTNTAPPATMSSRWAATIATGGCRDVLPIVRTDEINHHEQVGDRL